MLSSRPRMLDCVAQFGYLETRGGRKAITERSLISLSLRMSVMWRFRARGRTLSILALRKGHAIASRDPIGPYFEILEGGRALIYI